MGSDNASNLAPAIRAAVTHYGLFARIVDALLTPTELFRRLGDRSPWFDILVLTTLTSGVCVWLLWFSDVGQIMIADQQADILDRIKPRVSDAQFKTIAERLPKATVPPWRRATGVMMNHMASSVMLAAALTVVLSTLLARNSVKFRTILAVVSHASVVWTLGQILLALLSYVTVSPRSAATLNQVLAFAPWPSEGLGAAVIARLDIFMAWWIVIVSAGLAFAYRQERKWFTLGLAISYLIFITFTALVSSLFAPGSGFTSHGPPG